MYSYNGKDFRRYLYKTFFNNKDTNYRLTTKRLRVFLLSLGIYLPAEVLIWSGLLLDELFYPAYHDVKIKQPVFIIGNPRSGTTFLHRLLAKDTASFISMRTWEIFGAPSILMRRVFRRVAKLGRTLGAPVTRRIKRMQRLWKENDAIHRLAIYEPEEDEFLLIHIFSSLKIWSYAAMVEEAYPYVYYEDKIPPDGKQRTMDYYERCIQRHIFDHGGADKHYLSKSPNFSPMIDTLNTRFPDSKFIYLIRNPLQAVPSHISLKEREWQMLGSPLEEYACRDFILDASEHWYNYPLQRLKEFPQERSIIVRFDDLITNAEKTVRGIYDRFGLTVSPKYQDILHQETDRARNHQSKHEYSLAEMGITKEEMLERFKSVITEFNYD